MHRAHLDDVGIVTLIAIADDHPRPDSPSVWGDWGPMDLRARDMEMERWLVELTTPDGQTVAVGDLSSHAVWYGPTPGSRALNIGIGLVPEFRGLGIGSVAQRLLADLLHERGVVRVEASTDVLNVAEQRSLAKAGFSYEGTLRLAQGRRDGLHDLQVWSHIGEPPVGGSSGPSPTAS